MSDYRYDAVRNLAAVFLPRNREAQARVVDDMLAKRDEHIATLQTTWRAAEDRLTAAKQEIEQLRDFISRVRVLAQSIAECGGRCGDDQATRILQLEVPGAGAKAKRPRYREFRSRVQLCADCDRPELCAVVRKGTAPCGQNELVSIECVEVKR